MGFDVQNHFFAIYTLTPQKNHPFYSNYCQQFTFISFSFYQDCQTMKIVIHFQIQTFITIPNTQLSHHSLVSARIHIYYQAYHFAIHHVLRVGCLYTYQCNFNILIYFQMEPQKKIKLDVNGQQSVIPKPDFNLLYNMMMATSKHSDDHEFIPLLKSHRNKKHPILQTIQPQNQVYKSNPQKKKKPIELYLDAVNHLYKKRDLDILINPVTPTFVFEKWAPKEVAIFEESLLKFGKQFEFIAELIATKNVKQVYEFYLEWKSTSHYKSYRTHVSSNNRANIEDLV